MVDNNPGFTFPPAVCRLCGETTESPLPFFADGRDSLASSCLRFLPASVTKGWNIFDKLPKSVCHRCIQKVEEVRQFLQQITDVQERFKASLRENGISPDMDPADCPQMKVETCEDNLNGLDADSMDMGSAPYCEVKLSFPDETEEGTEDHVLTTPSVPRAARRGRRKGTVPRKLDSADKDDIGDGELDDSCGPQSETENAMSDTTSDAKPKSPGSIPCNNCDTTVRNFTELNRHYELSHAELTGASIKAKCPQCKKGVESSKWKEHKKSHRNRKRVMDACIYCGKLRPRKQMKRHLLIHTGTKTFHCGSCSRSFFLASELRNHEKSHAVKDEEDRTAFMCHICGRQFSCKGNLVNHMRTHTGEKPFSCKFCGKAFGQKANMEEHEHIHTQYKPYFCEICGAQFLRKRTLEMHTRMHTGERPHQCTICPKAFKRLQTLRKHMNVHNDIRPYACSHCGKRFRARDKMKIHERIHTGERPYSCDICGRGFYDKGNMRKHRRVHGTDSVSGLQKTAVGEIEDMPDESASMASPSQFMSPMSSVGGVSEDGGPSGHPHHPHHHPHPGGMSMYPLQLGLWAAAAMQHPTTGDE